MKQGGASRSTPDKRGSQRRAAERRSRRLRGEWPLAEQRALALTCRRSFHRTAPLGAETSDPWLELPIMERLPASASVSAAPAAATCDSITPAGWMDGGASATALPSQDLPTSSLSGPVTPGLLPTTLPRTLPEFRISGIRISLATKTAASHHCTSFLVAILSEGEPELEGTVG